MELPNQVVGFYSCRVKKKRQMQWSYKNDRKGFRDVQSESSFVPRNNITSTANVRKYKNWIASCYGYFFIGFANNFVLFLLIFNLNAMTVPIYFITGLLLTSWISHIVIPTHAAPNSLRSPQLLNLPAVPKGINSLKVIGIQWIL